MQSGASAVGEGDVMHTALAVHPGGPDLLAFIVLGIFRRPEADLVVERDRGVDVGREHVEMVDAQRLEVRARFLRRVHVGLGDDLDERRPGAVEVDARQPLFVHALADVLLDVDAADSAQRDWRSDRASLG